MLVCGSTNLAQASVNSAIKPFPFPDTIPIESETPSGQ